MSNKIRKAAAIQLAKTIVAGSETSQPIEALKEERVLEFAQSMVTQDPARVSKRVWGSVAAGSTLVLCQIHDPGTATLLSQYVAVSGVSAELISAILVRLIMLSSLAALILPLWSKVLDQRAIR